MLWRCTGRDQTKKKKKLSKKSFTAVIDAGTKWNGLILQYNAAIKLITAKVDEKAAYSTKKAKLGTYPSQQEGEKG